MSEKRKHQQEVDKLIKRCEEYLNTFFQNHGKFTSCESYASSVRYEEEMRKEIKKLQKLRESIKNWSNSPEIKSKYPIEEIKKNFDKAFEKFKECEKEMKFRAPTKDFSSTKTKDVSDYERSKQWVNMAIPKLRKRVELYKAEIESLSTKKGKSKNPTRSADLNNWIKDYQMYINKLENISFKRDSDDSIVKTINELREQVDTHLEPNEEAELNPQEIKNAELTHIETSDDTYKLSPTRDNTGDSLGPNGLEPNERPLANPPAKKNEGHAADTQTHKAKTKVCNSNESSQSQSTENETINFPLKNQVNSSDLSKPLTPATTTLSISDPSNEPKLTKFLHLTPSTSNNTTQPQNSIKNETKNTLPSKNTAQAHLKPSSLSPNLKHTDDEENYTATFLASNTTSLTPQKLSINEPYDLNKIPPHVPNETQEINDETNQKFTHKSNEPASRESPTSSTDFSEGFSASSFRKPPNDLNNILKQLEISYKNCPTRLDGDLSAQPQPKIPWKSPHPAFPSSKLLDIDTPEKYELFHADTLFFIFYYKLGTLQQYLAAKELQRRSWRFDRASYVWFHPQDDPRNKNENSEKSFVYFDFKNDWACKLETNYDFGYAYLESNSQD